MSVHSICQQIWKPQQWPQDWKRSVFIPIPKKSNAKECSNYRTIALILHASKVMLKILQARLQQYMNRELPVVQAGFRKGRGTSPCSPRDSQESSPTPQFKSINSSWGRKESGTTERFHFHFHALEKEMATHSSVLAWRIPGTGEPGRLPSMGSHRVGHD